MLSPEETLTKLRLDDVANHFMPLCQPIVSFRMTEVSARNRAQLTARHLLVCGNTPASSAVVANERYAGLSPVPAINFEKEHASSSGVMPQGPRSVDPEKRTRNGGATPAQSTEISKGRDANECYSTNMVTRPLSRS